ncbi:MULTISPECIES: hypothetical protein [unclassified Tychonema]|nr:MULTISPECIES: hypothetical protein [unclassified Tychonema]
MTQPGDDRAQFFKKCYGAIVVGLLDSVSGRSQREKFIQTVPTRG